MALICRITFLIWVKYYWILSCTGNGDAQVYTQRHRCTEFTTAFLMHGYYHPHKQLFGIVNRKAQMSPVF